MSSRLKNNFRGFSLIEFLIASAMALFLMTAFIKAYFNIFQSYSYQQGLARIQENASEALWLLQDEIMIADYMPSMFYIADTTRKNKVGNSIYGLYMKNPQAKTLPIEMVEGIEKIDIRYGVLNNHQIQYIDPYQVKKLDRVISLRVALLVNSVEPVTEKPKSYVFEGKTIMPTDRLLRVEWSTIITLRQYIP